MPRSLADGAPPAATFVLVPGAGGQGWYWHRVVDELRTRGHAAVAVDLPADDEEAGLDDYAAVVVDAIGGRRPVVVVAQSMGGLSATLACGLTAVDLLVLVNAMIPCPGETGGQWWEATGHAPARAELAASQGREVRGDFDVLDEFFHDVPDEVVAEALRLGAPGQSGTPFATPFPLARWPEVPTRVLIGRDDRFFPAAFQRRVALERLGALGVVPDELPGGHAIALARPVELTDRLEACWAEVA